VREDEGPAVPAIGTGAGETDSRGETGPSPSPLPRGRAPESDAVLPALAPQTARNGEAVKRPPTRTERMWRTPLHVLMKERGFG
jgi:hypothetical protein